MCAKSTLGSSGLLPSLLGATLVEEPRGGSARSSVFLLLPLLACLTAGGCGRSAKQDVPGGSDPQTSQTAPASAQGIGEFVIGEPIRHKNLTIFPVASKTPRSDDRYITLGEGLKTGTVQISEVGADNRAAAGAQPRAEELREEEPQEEMIERFPPSADDSVDDEPFGATESSAPLSEPSSTGDAQPEDSLADPFARSLDASAKQVEVNSESQEATDDVFGGTEPAGADVNRLMVVNRSDKPLYLMPGEIIYGGQQDRTIAEECIVAADGKPVAIKVYCVEHGRWGSRAAAQTAEGVQNLTISSGDALDAVAREKLTAEANQGKFIAQAGSLGKGARIAVQDDKGQQEVWDKVSVANAASGMTTDSGTFTANYTSPEMLKQLDEYIQALQTPVADHKQVVGAIVAVNGQVEAVDVFQSTPLFRKLWPVLLKSHAFDAATAAKDPGVEKLCTLKDAQEFLQATMHSGVEKKNDTPGGLVVTKRDSEKVMSFSAGEAKDTMGAMGGFGAGFGGAVHSSGFKK